MAIERSADVDRGSFFWYRKHTILKGFDGVITPESRKTLSESRGKPREEICKEIRPRRVSP